MGSVSSKGARASSRKNGKVPSWTGARIRPHEPKVSPLPTARQPWASETKDEGSASLVPNLYAQPNQIKAIQRDAKDPQFLANLNRLGPVRVDHHMQTIRTVSFLFCQTDTNGTDHFTFNTLSLFISFFFWFLVWQSEARELG
jgi:hypothetical protein